jgi:hypothetical protein
MNKLTMFVLAAVASRDGRQRRTRRRAVSVRGHSDGEARGASDLLHDPRGDQRDSIHDLHRG